MGMTTPARIVLAKVGLDGHDRGIKVVARGLRDEGFHVIYAGLWQSPEAVVRAVVDEDAGWLGLSLLSGAHMTLVPRVLEMMGQAGLGDVGLLVGGIIPEADVPKLLQLGVARVFGPGTVIHEIAEFLRVQDAGGHEQLLTQPLRCDRRALSRWLTQAARGEVAPTNRGGFAGPTATDHPQPLFPTGSGEEEGEAADRARGQPQVIAVTGSGGVGKSTLIGKLIEVIRRSQRSVAVLACDPQSPLTGGALLGDRIRMPNRPADDAVFIRSVATPGGRSGVAPNVDLMIGLFGRFGFDTVIVETVGAGQGDTAVRDVADVVIVLVQPETGDELQWEKAGLLEIADIVVVHKADLSGAERVESQLRELLNMPGCRSVPVVRVSSARETGVEELWAAVDECPGRPRAVAP
ncbi:cobalamin-dependent protein [Singulisphaera sp. Ch08]|uniref:Cobalamin-dependent protein n=1 Tax=Singulisphaera sp. Ch08 TaxID=3120278 RepID=A0AAU7C8Y9_9BACT